MHQPSSETELADGGIKIIFSSTKTEGQITNKAGDSKSIDSGEENVRRLLSEYAIGQKLRQLRLKKKIALTDLGRQTGLSASMLSQLENGKLVPTLPTLARIAMVFDTRLDHFFADKRELRLFSVVRADERRRFPEEVVPRRSTSADGTGASASHEDTLIPLGSASSAQPIPSIARDLLSTGAALRAFLGSPVPGYPFEVLASGAPHKNLSAYLAEFHLADEQTERLQHSHEGSEFIHVLEGVLALHYQAEQHLLGAGDSVHFDASESHSYSGHSETPAKAIIVTVPPRL